jgi:hypothetical protein
MLTDNEHWRDVPGFEGRYQVSDLGRVRSLPRYVRAVSKRGLEYQLFLRGRVLKPGTCKGYFIVNLSAENKQRMHRVNRLVALAFLPGEPAETVNHQDGDKANNRVGNLEWATQRENLNHAVRTGLNTQARRVTAPSGQAYPSIAVAARTERVNHRTAAKWAQA